jgi:hypothetical protein
VVTAIDQLLSVLFHGLWTRYGSLLAFIGQPESLTRSSRSWRWVFFPVDPLQRGVGRPGLKPRLIHIKLLITEQGFQLGRPHQFVQERTHACVIDQPLAIFGVDNVCRRLSICGQVPDQIIRAQTHKPANEQVVLSLLHEQPFGAESFERLQKGSQQQLFRWHRRLSFPGVEHLEATIQWVKRLIRQREDPSEGMVRWDSLLNGNGGEL